MKKRKPDPKRPEKTEIPVGEPRPVWFEGKPVPPDPQGYTTGSKALDREIDDLIQDCYPGRQLPKLDRQLQSLFDGCRTPEGVDAAVDDADAIVIQWSNTWLAPIKGELTLQFSVQFGEHYHGEILKLARQAKARIAERAARMLEGRTEQPGSCGAGKSTTEITLRDFLSEYSTESLSERRLTSVVNKIQTAARRKPKPLISLPAPTRKWTKGKKQHFTPESLIEKWAEYKVKLAGLPDLKS